LYWEIKSVICISEEFSIFKDYSLLTAPVQYNPLQNNQQACSTFILLPSLC